MTSVNLGVPISYESINSDEPLVFSYYSRVNESFVIKIEEEYGFSHILVNSLSDEQAREEALNIPKGNQEVHFSSLTQANRKEVKIYLSDKNYCVNCLYLISLENT
jgi:hypothetical protein